MSEIEATFNFIDKHFIKLMIGLAVMASLFLGGSCYSLGKVLKKYEADNVEKVESK